MKVLIVGGGIAGLTAAALFLEKKEFEVTLVEQAPNFGHIGYGISLFGHGRAILQELGIDDDVAKGSQIYPSFIMADASGKTLGHEVNFKYLDKLGKTTIGVERANLHETLVSKVKSLGLNIQLDTKVEHVHSTKDKAEVTFSNKNKKHLIW